MSLLRQLSTLLSAILCIYCLFSGLFGITTRFLTLPIHQGKTEVNQMATGHHELPLFVSIPSQNKTLPLVISKIENNYWPISNNAVSLLTINNLKPGQDSGYVLYGHNWPNLLGNLNTLKIGQSINLEFTHGQTKEYIADSIFDVTPNQFEILNLAKYPDSLLIYTCAGWLDQKRVVVLAHLTKSDRLQVVSK